MYMHVYYNRFSQQAKLVRAMLQYETIDVSCGSNLMQKDNWINGDVLKKNNFYNNNKLIVTVLTL